MWMRSVFDLPFLCCIDRFSSMCHCIVIDPRHELVVSVLKRWQKEALKLMSLDIFYGAEVDFA